MAETFIEHLWACIVGNLMPQCRHPAVLELHWSSTSSHLATVLLYRRVVLDISLFAFLSRRCIRLILPIMSMVTTFFIPLLQKTTGLVNIWFNYGSASPQKSDYVLARVETK